MATYPQMGSFLLTADLGVDPLGQYHRAVTVTRGAFENLHLVRTFSKELIEAGITARIPEAAENLSAFDNARVFGSGYRFGSGVAPHLACDYPAGRSLASLLEKVVHEEIPFGIEHVLSVVQNLAQGLISLHSMGLSHGTLSPHSVWVSFEGAAQIIDAPSAGIVKALLSKCPCAKKQLAPYTCESAHSPLERDLFALGSIFFELLTHTKLPSQPDIAAAVRDGVLGGSTEKMRLPRSIQALLLRLFRVGSPYPDLTIFEADLRRVLYEDEYEPSTFSMAMFMHGLFRFEKEQDQKAIEAEKSNDYSAYENALEAANAGSLALAGVPDASTPAVDRSIALKVGLVLTVVVVVVIGGFLVRKGFREKEEQLVALRREQSVANQKSEALKVQENVVRAQQEVLAKQMEEVKVGKEKQALQRQLDEKLAEEANLAATRQKEERAVKEKQSRTKNLNPNTTLSNVSGSASPAQGSIPSASKSTDGSRMASSAPPGADITGPATSTEVPTGQGLAEQGEVGVRVLAQASPSLPQQARNPKNPLRDGEPVIKVFVYVNASGKAEKVTVVNEPADAYAWGYTQAAIEAGMRSTFSPATVSGKPTAGFTKMVLRFPRAR